MATTNSALDYAAAAPASARDKSRPRATSPAAASGLRYLRPDEHPIWDDLVEVSPQGSVFCRSWYLQAAGGETRVLGWFDGGRLVAGIPLHYERRMGFKLCCMPRLTPAWGVVIEPLSGKRTSAAARETDILTRFAEHLSGERAFVQAFHPVSHNWLPFRWNGFRQTTRFTYVIEDLNDPDRIWSEMSESCRRQIRRAERQSVQVRTCAPDVVLTAIQKTFRRQRMRLPYARHVFTGLCGAAAQHGAGQCFAAEDTRGRVHAAACLIWDKKRTYYLAGGGDPEIRQSGATSLLMWHLIQCAASRSALFDFEGSDIQPIERFFRGFGAKQHRYNYITKFPRWMAALLVLAGKI